MSENIVGAGSDPATPVNTPVSSEVEKIELLEEVLRVAKRTVERGHVRVSVLTDTTEQQVLETLHSRRIGVERVAVGRQLAAGETAPQSRIEGNLLIVPMVEEILVVEKRLVLREELHIQIAWDQQKVEQTVSLRRQRAEVEELRDQAGELVR